MDRYNDLILREGTRAAILNRSTNRTSSLNAFDITQLKQPTLIIWGRHDNLIPVSVGEQFDRTLPNSELVVFEDLGHIPMEEDPERSASKVLGFLEAHGAFR